MSRFKRRGRGGGSPRRYQPGAYGAREATFDERANAFLAALPDFRADLATASPGAQRPGEPRD
jgi:hypothetical protein